jgi:hypothetical protein
MPQRKTLEERALELAHEGRWRSLTRIKTLLKREGYIGVEAAFNRSELWREVDAIMKATRNAVGGDPPA